MKRIRVVVLVSGGGTNLQSIIDASENGRINAEVVLVISNIENAYALERARKHGIDAMFISDKKKKRRAHEEEMAEVIDRYNVDLIVLAGYLKMFTPFFIRRYHGKIINIHPALLPLFGGEGMYGQKVHKAALDLGVKVSGCSVHFVDESIDGGPIIAQKAVKIEEDDTPETLAERILKEEHILLPKAIQLFAEGRLRIEGRRVRILKKRN